jgi:hypothetical protein
VISNISQHAQQRNAVFLHNFAYSLIVTIIAIKLKATTIIHYVTDFEKLAKLHRVPTDGGHSAWSVVIGIVSSCESETAS